MGERKGKEGREKGKGRKEGYEGAKMCGVEKMGQAKENGRVKGSYKKCEEKSREKEETRNKWNRGEKKWRLIWTVIEGRKRRIMKRI